jgi:uncharacterized protein (TIGR03000 family)
MYSAVLMLALTAGSETADFGRHGCTGYSGCSAPVVASYGCPPSCHGGLFAKRHTSHGCTSTYSAPVMATCSSYGYGCSSSCHGGGLFARMREKHSCHGYAASTCCTPVVTGTCSTPVMMKETEMKSMPKGETVPPPMKEKKVQATAPATILVSLPAGARLTVDGAATKSIAAKRTLITPALEVGSTYSYTLRAEFVSEGRTMVQSQVVNVRGGETSTVQFNLSTQAVASR